MTRLRVQTFHPPRSRGIPITLGQPQHNGRGYWKLSHFSPYRFTVSKFSSESRRIDSLGLASLKVDVSDPGEGSEGGRNRRSEFRGKRYLLNNVSSRKRGRRCRANSIKCAHVNPRFRFKRFPALNTPPFDPPGRRLFRRDDLRKLDSKLETFR